MFKPMLSPMVKWSGVLAMLLFGVLAVSATQAATSYDDITGGVIIPDNACGVTPVVRTINVPSMIITDVNFGINIFHSNRGDLRVTLQSPQGTSVDVIAISGDVDLHYGVMLDDASANPLDDGGTDIVVAPFYDRYAQPSNPLSVFNGQNAGGNWTVTICDGVNLANGTYNRSQLQISGTATAVGGTAEYVAVDTAKGYAGWLLVGVSSLAVVMGLVGGLWVWRSR